MIRARLVTALTLVGTLIVTGCVISPPSATTPQQNGTPQIAAGRAAIERKLRKLEVAGPKSFDKPREAAEFYRMQRLAPGQTELPLEHLHAEFEALRARQAAQPRDAAPGDISSWTWVGPGNVGGRTRALVIHPQQPDIMYAAGVSGGIWKTTDGGANWSPLDDMMLNLAVTTMVMDPTDPNTIYAGTGEGWYGGISSFVRGLGIFKSTDAGATWIQLTGTVTGVPNGAFHYVNKLAISPNNPNRIYAATRFGVWRSLDAGQTWSVRLANPDYTSGPAQSNGCFVGCTDLVVRADRNPDVIFAAFGSLEADGLFRSDDGGETWLAYTTGVNQGRMSLALAPSNNDVMYILMADNGDGGAIGQLVNVYRTVDGGASFEARVNFASLTGPWLLNNLVFETGCAAGPGYAQGWYDNIIAVDPVDPDVVWVGGVDLFRSDDGAQNFGIAAYWFFYLVVPPPPYQVHPDHHAIVFHPNYDGGTNQIMYFGNDGGLFKTQNARAATSQEDCPFPGDDPLPEIVFERLNNNYGVTQFYHGDAAKQMDRFTGGCQDNGTNQVNAVGTPNDWNIIFGGDGGYVAIDPTDPDTIYVEIQFFPEIRKSTDGGATFAYAINGITDTNGLFITPFAMDQNNPSVLWTGGTRPWRTTNAASSWAPAGPFFAAPGQISAIAIAPTDGNVVYLGFNNGYVAVTGSGLSPSPTWLVRGATTGLPTGSYMSSLAVDPVDPDIAYATYSTFGIPHIYRTMDRGAHWTAIDGIGASGVPDIPVHWIEPRPSNPDQLYAATELGVFASDDAGQTWQPANTGLANVVVESLDFKNENTLVAFTHGRGVFVADLTGNGPLGDFDGDGDVDTADFAIFAQCFGGSLNPPAASCPPGVNADLDADGDVDTADFAIFGQNFTGSL